MLAEVLLAAVGVSHTIGKMEGNILTKIERSGQEQHTIYNKVTRMEGTLAALGTTSTELRVKGDGIEKRVEKVEDDVDGLKQKVAVHGVKLEDLAGA